MGLFDIIDDIAEKQVMKTDTGDNRIFGVVIGKVMKNYDRDMPGRVCVSVPTRDEGANELKWARVAMPYSGSKWGQYYLPEVGDQVLLIFEQGNIEKPYVIGSIPRENDKLLRDSVHEKNQYKNIVTRNGNTITMEDNAEGEGKKDKILIKTSANTHRMELDNEKNLILFSDKEGKNKIELATQKGEMLLKAEKKLVIRVGESIELIMNGSNGAVTLKASRLNVEAKNSINMQSSASALLKAANISQEASGMMKLSSNGAVTVQGMPIKLG